MNPEIETRAVVCELDGAVPPTEILISPWGTVKSEKGDFLIDTEAVGAIIAAFTGHGVDLPIDFEHQTLGGGYSSPTGQAPAAGWVKRLFAIPGKGLFATVSWTADAARLLATRAYRYLSPVVLVRKSDGRAVELHSAALTNKPAIVGMVPMVNSTRVIAMNDYERLLSELRTLLKLDVGADEAAVLGAIRETVGQSASVNSAGALDATQYVLRADLETAVERAETAETEVQTMKADAFLADGQRQGKITDHGRDLWLQAFSVNPELARLQLDGAPVIAPPSGRLVAKRSGVAGLGAGGGDRRAVILSAWSEYAREPGLRQLTTAANFVNCELQRASHVLLSQDEARAVERDQS